MVRGWSIRLGRRGTGSAPEAGSASPPAPTSREGRARILVADSSPILLASVEMMFATHGELDVQAVGDLSSLHQAVALQRPDAILVDVDLQPRGGIDAVACVSAFCDAPLFVWGLAPTDGQEAAARLAGASGFVRKDVSFAALASTLRELAGGRQPACGDPALATVGIEGGI